MYVITLVVARPECRAIREGVRRELVPEARLDCPCSGPGPPFLNKNPSTHELPQNACCQNLATNKVLHQHQHVGVEGTTVQVLRIPETIRH